MIDFPAAPVAGQIFFASNGAVYQYNSTYTSWVQIASSVLQDATFSVQGSGAVWAPAGTGAWETCLPATVTVGNAGGWYNTSTGVFTPPAGRYRLSGTLAFNSSTSNMLGQLRWRKNGVTIPNNDTAQNTAGTNLFSTVYCEVIVDANGTDMFDLQAQCNVLMSNAYGTISAYPLSQQSLAGGSSWRQIARVVPVAAPTVDFQNLPADINDLMFQFDVIPSTNTHDFAVQFYDAAGALITTSYAWANTVGAHTQNGTAAVVAGSNGVAFTTMIPFDYPVVNRVVGNASGIRGRGEMRNIRDAARIKSISYQADYVSDDGTVFLASTGSGYRPPAGAISGLRFLWQPSVNFTAGGEITLWGSP